MLTSKSSAKRQSVDKPLLSMGPCDTDLWPFCPITGCQTHELGKIVQPCVKFLRTFVLNLRTWIQRCKYTGQDTDAAEGQDVWNVLQRQATLTWFRCALASLLLLLSKEKSPFTFLTGRCFTTRWRRLLQHMLLWHHQKCWNGWNCIMWLVIHYLCHPASGQHYLPRNPHYSPKYDFRRVMWTRFVHLKSWLKQKYCVI